MTIQDDYLKLRQQAEAQAFKEYDDRYASARSPSASYRDVIGLVHSSNGILTVGQGLDTGRLFRNDYADTNRDGKISGDEIKTLEQYDHRDLLQAAMVMERVNTLIANPSQITTDPSRLPDTAVLQQRRALEETKTDHELRQYIVDGTSNSYNAFAAAKLPTPQPAPEPQTIAQTESVAPSLTQIAAVGLPGVAMLNPITQPLGALMAPLGALLASRDTQQAPQAETELAGPPAPHAAEAPSATNDLIAYAGTKLKGDNGKEFTGVLFKGVHHIDPKFAGENGLVAQLQRDLKELKLYEGEIDGKFGPATETAVKKFQQEHGLENSGIAGKETIAAIQIMQVASIPANTLAPDAETAKIQKEKSEAYAAIGNYSGILPDSIKNMMAVSGLELQANNDVRLATTPAGAAPAPSAERG